mmetsp:Transcript_15128/g.32840  ORF Transcript_15128/g.32840 Transcript_15128/m.32840 type:complete len:329 (+) Transcript_15128:190-1176(+)|eukprot:CAMPEP_0172316678 /NCGR_PEP_ID=MMETSP1058-20130122/29060_1 /TAXON_ID=83371 /ORGANISM="Detonula confervacea, Strain CCMP 353" /LENGTH=328 /DNA_ID=CAMNT_0013031043 /DNA_START=115 /DNA_END=1101 /DNA_ORIENTATION=-
MAKSNGSKLYAVAKGRVPGIYNTWSECQSQTSGYGGAIFKSFKAHNEAQAFMQANNSSSNPSSVSLAASAASSSSAASSKDKGRKRSREDKVASSQRKKTSNQQKQSSASNFRLQITIYFDGGSRGNPGVAGAGAEIVVVDNSTEATSTTSYSVREYCGDRATNNYAEYKGLLAGLKQAKLCIEQSSSKQLPTTTTPLFQLQVYGDSNLIIQQLKGNYRCNHPNLKPLFLQSQTLIEEMKKNDGKSEVLYEHVYREHNKVADALANEAMDRRESWVTSTGNSNNSGDEKKTPVATKSEANKGNNHLAASSTQEVIDVDVSDNDSHLSC